MLPCAASCALLSVCGPSRWVPVEHTPLLCCPSLCCCAVRAPIGAAPATYGQPGGLPAWEPKGHTTCAVAAWRRVTLPLPPAPTRAASWPTCVEAGEAHAQRARLCLPGHVGRHQVVHGRQRDALAQALQVSVYSFPSFEIREV